MVLIPLPADSKQNAISKSLFQDSFWHIFLGNEENASYFLKKKRPLAPMARKNINDNMKLDCKGIDEMQPLVATTTDWGLGSFS